MNLALTYKYEVVRILFRRFGRPVPCLNREVIMVRISEGDHPQHARGDTTGLSVTANLLEMKKK